ncbi:MAG: DUF3667 domain-containing protein [Bacteroidetes bacterium]|nr:DUF3667 domain-containing protein [Bacteroidota bacterium]
MSGSRIRKEPVCLNCGQDVQGRFCTVCGQENIEPRENFRSLLTHFIKDFTHFDGKFFHTIRVLLFQPGELSKAYINGKRASYLHPIRMYLFISFAFFLIIYLTEKVSSTEVPASQTPSIDSVTTVLTKQIVALQKKQQPNDSGIGDFVIREKILQLEKRKWQLKADSSQITEIWKNLNDSSLVFDSKDSNLVSAEWYELQQRQLPPEKRDSGVEHWIKKKIARANGKFNSSSELISLLSEKFPAQLPKLLFISLPLVALLLAGLYFRRKQWGYADHAILTLHLFSATFLLLAIQLILSLVFTMLHWNLINRILGIGFGILLPFFYYSSLRNFYAQSIRKTIWKTFLLLLGSTFILVIIFSMSVLLALLSLH